MATELFMVKRLGSLVPADDAGKVALDDVRLGEIVRVTLAKPRNVKFHRMYFALLNLVSENTDYTPDELLLLVKIGIGHVDWVTHEGKVYPSPKSISFAKMDDVSFRDFFNRSVDLIITRIIPGTGKADLERELFEILGIPSWSPI